MRDIISRGMAAVAMAEVTVLNNYVTSQLIKIDLIKVVPELPEVGEENKIYMLPKNVGESSEQDFYDEYIWVNKGTETEPVYQWEFVASRPYNVDLSNYATKEFVEEQMSTNDIIKTEYELSSSTATYEVKGEVINVEMKDSVTGEVILGGTTITVKDGKSVISIKFTSKPTNMVKVIIFSTN